MLRIALLILTTLTTVGCSVGMALSGKPEPNISALNVGQDRDIVILNIGQPTKTFTTEAGRTDVFHLERGNEPSVGRAAGHAAMDVMTLGLWELFGTPIEGFSGETFTISIEYDEHDKVKKVSTAEGHRF